MLDVEREEIRPVEGLLIKFRDNNLNYRDLPRSA